MNVCIVKMREKLRKLISVLFAEKQSLVKQVRVTRYNAHLILPEYPDPVKKLADSMVLMLQLARQLDRTGWDGTVYRETVAKKNVTLGKMTGGVLFVEEV